MAAGAAGIRVVHVGPVGGPPNGMQTVILTIADLKLGADEVEVMPTWEIGPGFRRRLLPALKTTARLLGRDLRGWVVHIHVSQRGSFFRKGLVLLAAKARGAKVVVTPHGDEFNVYARNHPRVVRSFLRRCDGATVLSSEHMAILRDLCPGIDVELVPNPVAVPDEVSPAGDQEPVVLFLGTVCLRKGVDVLVDAWPLVREAVPEARCVIAGPVTDYTVPSLPGLEAIGQVDHREAPELISRCRVVCLPSRSEVLPMTLLEAMANARPIVATSVGEVVPLTARGGIGIPVADRGALAEALISLLSDPGKATRLGLEGRRMTVTEFGPGPVGVGLRRVYSSALDVVENRPSGPSRSGGRSGS